MSSTDHRYPPVHRPESSANTVPSAMGQKLQAVADRFQAMTQAAIEESKAQPAPVEPAAPPAPVRVNWDEEIDNEALINRRREATDWLPTQVVVGAAAVQVVPYRQNRAGLSLSNTGANAATIGATESAVNNSTSNTFSLAAGATLQLDMEAAVWAASASGTTIVAIETYYGRQALNRAVAHLIALARARVGAPQAVTPVPPAKSGEKGLL